MEIKELLKARPIENTKLSLEEISSIITSPEEAVNFMYSRGYVYSYQTNFNLETDNINWVWATPAHYAYKYNGGGCGATANLFNKLLSNCCNSEGYISFITNGGGHAMNYIKINNLYYYYDFTNINPKYYGGINLYGSQDVGINNNSLYYL